NRIAELIGITASRKGQHTGRGCARLATTCNTLQDNPLSVGSFHSTSGAEAAINVGMSAAPFLPELFGQLSSGADADDVAEAARRLAFKMVRAGEFVGIKCAESLSRTNGISVTLGRVYISVSPGSLARSSDEIPGSGGLLKMGRPGSSAKYALLISAIDRAGFMASPAYHGLHGDWHTAFAEQTALYAMPHGFFSTASAEVVNRIQSSACGMVAVPIDTPPRTVAGLLSDCISAGLANDQQRSIRIVPIEGKPAGDVLDFGHVLGRTVVLPIDAPAS
ncbi:MAG: DUF711 family protein, partial [Rhodothermales bacterium]|nr:DUF711 family protein [Rhodothermales bacterium]